MIIIFMLPSNTPHDHPLTLLRQQTPHIALQSLQNSLPTQPSLFLTKALLELSTNHPKTCESSLLKLISHDPLNHHAYYNLFALHLRQGDLPSAFKNLCCCLSVAYLLKAEREENLDCVQKAIEYCFNNKEARLLKCVLKMKAGKTIQALNQINYALYLAPSHQALKIVQEKVYRQMGMKQLKGKSTTFQKEKYDRLETNMEVPSQEKIQNQIKRLLKEYDALIKGMENSDAYKVLLTPKEKEKENKVQGVEKMPQKDSDGKKTALKFYLTATQAKSQEETVMMVSQTEWNNQKQEKQSTTNNSEHITKQQSLKPSQEHAHEQPFFFLDSSLSNISISNISQNSHIKMNKLRANMVDFPQGSFAKGQERSFSQNGLSSSLNSQGSKGELKLPLRLSELKNNEKIVVTLQRTVMNEKGQMEKIEELYEVVQGNNKLELVKVNK